jgi:N-acetyl-anhydromuramyl-L-alanine amidase AmpD
MQIKSRVSVRILDRSLRFLPLIFFVVTVASFGVLGGAQQGGSSSLEASLQQIQEKYDAAMHEDYLRYAPYFEKAYQSYPVIPRGMLEAIAYAETDFHYNIPNEEAKYPSYGLMGLRLKGKGVFKDNLLLVSDLSGYTIDEIKYDPEIHIMAFAGAYVALMNQFQISNEQPVEAHIPILREIGNLPDKKKGIGRLPMDVYLYTVLSFLGDSKYQPMFNFPEYSIDLQAVFGESNYNVLSSNYLNFSNSNTLNSYGISRSLVNSECSQCSYPAAIDTRTLGHPSRFQRGLPNPRDRAAITHIVIHSTETEDGPENQNNAYQAQLNLWATEDPNGTAAHYLISKTGQIAMPYNERAPVAHIGNHNTYTIGIEHIGKAEDPRGWPAATYQASASLVRGIACCYGISPVAMYFGNGTGGAFPYFLPDCIHIKGHGHYAPSFAGHFDPGAYWNWFDYYRLVNGGAEPPFSRPAETRTRCSGYLEDLGGPAGDYPPNQRYVVTISPQGAAKVKLKFSKFNTAAGDWLVVWDGPVPDAARYIGAWSLNGLPNGGQIISTSSSITVEFRSDCGNEADGWELNWEGLNADGSSACCPGNQRR